MGVGGDAAGGGNGEEVGGPLCGAVPLFRLGMQELERRLFELYTAEIYPVLAAHDPEYKRALALCGIWANVKTVAPERRADFEKVMKMWARIGAQWLLQMNSLEAASIRAKLLEGKEVMYRVTSANSKAPIGRWWFSERVAARCREEAPKKGMTQLEWLREMLAVCKNWNRSFDQLERLELRRGESLPAVLGIGKAMPYYKLDHKNWENAPDDYWKRQGQVLEGGERQIVLPWVPAGRVQKVSSLV